jgi:ADP-ribose pyrophosphatase
MNLDEDEFLETERIPLEKAVDMVMKSEIVDGKSQVLILKIANLVREGKI